MTSTGQQRYAGVFTPTTSPESSPPTNINDTIIVSPGFETGALVESIQSFPLAEIGSEKFMEVYCITLERLSIQAHLTAEQVSARESVDVPLKSVAMSPLLVGRSTFSGGEYIVEAFLERPEKMEALVKTLMSIEFWRERVLLRRRGNTEDGREEVLHGADDEVLARRLATNGNALRAAFVLHAETTIISLLNLIFYHGVPAVFLEGNGDEVMLALIDYCARQLIFLGTPQDSNKAMHKQKNPLSTSKLADYLQQRSRLMEIEDSIHDCTYQTAILAVALSQYLSSNINELGPSLVSRMLEDHDFPLLMVPLIEEPPWTRRRLSDKEGKSTTIWEKLNEHNEWSVVSPSDLLRLTKLEGQPWLALFHLTTSKICRESYGLDEFRKSNLMRLQRYLHTTLFDQLPVLEEVARYLDELSILGVPASGQGVYRPSSNASSSGLLLSRVDVLRESIVSKKQMNDDSFWNGIVRKQWEEIFSCITDSRDISLRRIANEIYGGVGFDYDTTSRDVVTNNSVIASTNHSMEVQDCLVTKSSKPVETVTLIYHDECDEIAEYELVPDSDTPYAITETPLGQFKRVKLSITLVSGGSEAICPNAKVVARIRFLSSSSSDHEENNLSLSMDSLSLPTNQQCPSPNSYDELGIPLPDFPAKEWRQLGDLPKRSAVLQLGFARLDCGTVPAGCTYLRGYKLSQAFFSQPVLDS